jgi:hypothetical protein
MHFKMPMVVEEQAAQQSAGMAIKISIRQYISQQAGLCRERNAVACAKSSEQLRTVCNRIGRGGFITVSILKVAPFRRITVTVFIIGWIPFFGMVPSQTHFRYLSRLCHYENHISTTPSTVSMHPL